MSKTILFQKQDGNTMKKNEEVYIKITPTIQFDNNAPNFTKEKDVISWNPSVEEWAFC